MILLPLFISRHKIIGIMLVLWYQLLQKHPASQYGHSISGRKSPSRRCSRARVWQCKYISVQRIYIIEHGWLIYDLYICICAWDTGLKFLYSPISRWWWRNIPLHGPAILCKHIESFDIHSFLGHIILFSLDMESQTISILDPMPIPHNFKLWFYSMDVFV